jgi:hypothetical protein
MAARKRHRREVKMSEKVDAEGRVSVMVRLYPEEVKLLDAIKEALDRESRQSTVRAGIKDWMKRMQADKAIGPRIAEIVKAQAGT